MAKPKTDRLQVRIDPNEKERAMALFDSLGLTVSDAVTLFIRKSLIANGLPFSVDHSTPANTQMSINKRI